MGKRGVPKGTRYKAETDLCRNRYWVMVTDEQSELLEDMVAEYGIKFAHAIRICLDIVADMPLSEYQSAVKKKVWKK